MPRSAWTWLVYMAVDGRKHGELELADVAAQAGQSVVRFASAKRGKRVRVLVQEDSEDGASRYEVGEGSPTDLGQIDSGDPGTLAAFVQWGVATAPAERYALVLWSHGSGWQSSYSSISSAAPKPSADRGSASAPGGFFSTTRQKLEALAPKDRAIAGDNGTGQAIDTIELGKLLAGLAPSLNGKVDLLLMNACQMASIEVAYQLRKHVGVYVATEVNMPASSLPYDSILSRLGAKPEMDADALGALLAEEYCAFQTLHSEFKGKWGQKGYPPGASMTAVRPGKLQGLADAVKALGAAIRAGLPGTALGDVLWEVVDKAPIHRSLRLGDLERFARLLVADKRTTPPVRAAAEAVLKAARDPGLIAARQFTSSIPSAAILGEQVGLTTFLPMPNNEGKTMVATEYSTTDYGRYTAWGETLTAWHEAMK